MTMKVLRWQVTIIFSILCSSILLVSCAPRMPIYIQDVWVSEPPTVGKIVRLGMKVTTIGDEENIVLTINYPETIAVIESPSYWDFGLKDKEEKEVFSDICVLESGSWLIEVGIASFFENGEMKYGDLRAIGVISYSSQATVLLEKDITYSQAAETQRSNYEVVKVSVDECSR